MIGIVASATGMISPSSEASERGTGAAHAVTLAAAPDPAVPAAAHTPASRTKVAAAAAMSLQRRPLAHRVVLVASGEHVRRRQTHLADSSEPSVPPRIGRPNRLDPLVADRLLGGRDDLGFWRDERFHVAVLLAHLEVHVRAGEGHQHLVGDDSQQRNVRLQQVIVEVAHDQPQFGARGVTLDQVRMHETLASRGRLGRQPVRWERGHDRGDDSQGIDELAVGGPGMHVDAAHRDPDLNGREALVLQLADLRAVDRVCAARAELADVEQRGALADLLVRREGDPDRRPRQLRVGGQMGHRGHDLGHPGLVIGAEQRVAAGSDDVVSVLGLQGRHRRRVEACVLTRQLDHAPGVGAVHDRLDTGSGGIRGHIHVGDQTDHGRVLRARGQRGEHVAVLVLGRVAQPGGVQILHQHAAELDLARRARRLRALAGSLGVDAHVTREALEQSGCQAGGEL